MAEKTEREKAQSSVAENRKAFHDFHLMETFEAGLVRSVCSYKPTLLVLILPMLLLMRQWRTLAGFACGGAILAGLSLATVGPTACAQYVGLLCDYAGRTGGAGMHGLRIWKFIDLNSCLKLLHVPRITAWCVLLSVAGLLAREAWTLRPRSARDAHRNLPLAWAATISWTMVLNVYVGVYDSVLILPAIVLTTSALLRRAGDGTCRCASAASWRRCGCCRGYRGSSRATSGFSPTRWRYLLWAFTSCTC